MYNKKESQPHNSRGQESQAQVESMQYGQFLVRSLFQYCMQTPTFLLCPYMVETDYFPFYMRAQFSWIKLSLMALFNPGQLFKGLISDTVL